jgi:uncharacterized protein YjbI with pentapeptide repeats
MFELENLRNTIETLHELSEFSNYYYEIKNKQKDTTLKDTTLKDTTLKDTTLKDTTLKDTTLKDTTLKDTTLKDTTLKDYIIALNSCITDTVESKILLHSPVTRLSIILHPFWV